MKQQESLIHKAIATFASVALVIGMVPSAAFAETGNTIAPEVSNSQETIVTTDSTLQADGNIAKGESGECNWVIDSEGTLTVSPKDGVSGTLGTWSGSSGAPWYVNRESIKSVVFEKNITAQTCTYMFNGCTALNSIDFSNLNTSNVTDMSCMFFRCTALESVNLKSLDMSSVKSTVDMFQFCKSLNTLDLSDTALTQLTDARSMFFSSSIKAINLTNTSAPQLTEASQMFASCTSLQTIDMSSFKADSLSSIYEMFSACSSLTSANLSGVSASNVTDMSGMFYNCSALTSVNLSSFDTSNVTCMSLMFEGCSSLKTINVGNNWNTNAVTLSADMFKDCTSLVGGAGTAYDATHVDKEYARIDGGTSAPGYLSNAPKYTVGDVNDNGEINIVDAQIVLDMTNGIWTTAGSSTKYDKLLTELANGWDEATLTLAADANTNGKVDATDARAIQNYVHNGAFKETA